MSEAFWMVSYGIVLAVTSAAEGALSKCRLAEPSRRR